MVIVLGRRFTLRVSVKVMLHNVVHLHGCVVGKVYERRQTQSLLHQAFDSDNVPSIPGHASLLPPPPQPGCPARLQPVPL